MEKYKDSQYGKGGQQKMVYSNMDELAYWPCPFCGSSEELKIKNEFGLLGIVKCQKCSLIRVNPRLEKPDLIYHGKKEMYEKEFKLMLTDDRPHHRDKNYMADINIIRRYKSEGEFLDIGTNSGFFLRLARGQGWKLTGIEPSPPLAELASECWGLNIINKFLENADLQTGYYDVVTMTDVFEHIVNPKEVLLEVKRIMKNDGIALIKVPNAKFNEFKFFVRSKLLGKQDCDDFDSYEHVCHYTDTTLKNMLTHCGFKILKLIVDLPVQIPAWHKYVGEYYQYPSPFFMDWKAYLGRSFCYYFSRIEYLMMSRVGFLAPTITCIVTPQ